MGKRDTSDSDFGQSIYLHVQTVFDEFLRQNKHEHFSYSVNKVVSGGDGSCDKESLGGDVHVFTLYVVVKERPFGKEMKVLHVKADKDQIISVEETYSK